jgi:hypothetical protein
MVDRAGILNSQLAGHDGRAARAASSVIIKNRPFPVGWAQAKQCTLFGSFDTNSGARALAYARGLKVWPEMTEKDFAQFARLKN